MTLLDCLRGPHEWGYRDPAVGGFVNDVIPYVAADEIERLRATLEQIAIVCTDNMDRDKDHRMALEFVRQIANARLDVPGNDSGTT